MSTRRVTVITTEHVKDWHLKEIRRRMEELEDLIWSLETGNPIPVY